MKGAALPAATASSVASRPLQFQQLTKHLVSAET
jgi:hypothetical protein